MVALAPEVFAAARTHMVDSQLRPNKVTDKRLFDICSELPRESFFPVELAARAYTDENIRLGNGRSALPPMPLVRMIQALEIEAGEKVLVVGAGNGYGAAVLAKLGAKVTALEPDAALARIARAGLAAQAPSVTLVAGPLEQGWAASAPYDAIIVEGAADFVPEALHRPEVLALTARVMPYVDADFDAKWGRNICPTRVEAVVDGKVFTAQVDLPKGGPANPMTNADLRAKLEDCLSFGGFDVGSANVFDEVIAGLLTSKDVAADLHKLNTGIVKGLRLAAA